MAQFDLNEDMLIAATADQIARRLISEASFVQRLANASVSSLLSLQQLRDSYEAGVKKALDARIESAKATIAAIPVDLARWQRMASEEEQRWQQQLRSAAQEVIAQSKIKMQRTLRQAVADLLKDRVDALVARLMEPK